MFEKTIQKKITELEKDILQAVKEVNDTKFNATHKVCKACNITGHTVDMKEVWNAIDGHCWFHNGCYAEKYNVHLCPCKCGKWISNKERKHE